MVSDEQMKEMLEASFELGRRAEQARLDQVAGLNRRLRRAYWLTLVLVVACVIVGVGAFAVFKESADIRTLIGCAVLILIMYESTVLMKLWYWIVHTRISVQKELKEMTLQIAELRAALARDE